MGKKDLKSRCNTTGNEGKVVVGTIILFFLWFIHIFLFYFSMEILTFYSKRRFTRERASGNRRENNWRVRDFHLHLKRLRNEPLTSWKSSTLSPFDSLISSLDWWVSFFFSLSPILWIFVREKVPPFVQSRSTRSLERQTQLQLI